MSRASDFFKVYKFLIKFNHLYLGTGCVCFLGKGKGGTPHMHGHKESNKDLNLKILTSEWDSNPRPHEYQSDALPTELSGV